MKYVVNGVVLNNDKVLLARNTILIDQAGRRADVDDDLSDQQIQNQGLNRKLRDFFSLPGGGVKPGESLKQALKREMLEETGVNAEIGELLFINEYKLDEGSYAGPNFIFRINNTEDFIDADFSKASHSFEVKEIGFYSLDTTEPVRPKWLLERLSKDQSEIQFISDKERRK